MNALRSAIVAAILGLPPLAAAPAERIVELTFRSRSLGRDMTFAAVLPESTAPSGGRPVLFLLHGRGRNRRSLIDNASARRELLAAPFATVLPDGDDGWYIDSPVKPADRYGEYLEEVIAEAESRLAVGRAPAREAIAGWSMGGYGAVRFAERHPGKFVAVVGIVGLVDFPRPASLAAGQNYTVPARHFGGDPAVWRNYNPILDIAPLRESRVLLVTGRGSFDRTMNENFSKAARTAGVDCRLIEIKGAHTLETVVSALPIALRFAASALADGPAVR